ncbi:DUF3592 domain-containing protein [Streptomyces sp. NPDC058646]|uniref:DUF3592 domain-containing protein n=1 Tax=Streptomyces sp. NPDC058646 TaxID=3346574 RepID=UPI00364867A2
MDEAAKADTSGTPESGSKRRTAILLPLALALLLGALSGLVLLPQAHHLRSLQDGVRAPATLHTSGTCVLGKCKVTFEADGRTIVADLPAGSGNGKNPAGTQLTVRYRADDPQAVADENDVDGGGAAVMAAMSGGAALIFLALSVLKTVTLARRQRADATRWTIA